jgi:LemA protein
MTAGVIFILIAIALLVWGFFAFNRLVRLRNQVRNAWADIDVQLKRRHDLIPPLVAAVKGYMGHERGVLQSVTELRSQATTLTSPAKLGDVESALGQALVPLLALKEAYPDLKANQNFLQLQRDLVEVEDHLQYARRFYNGAVRENNTAVQRIPDMFIAKGFGFPEAEFFQAGEEDRAVVNVDLAS